MSDLLNKFQEFCKENNTDMQSVLREIDEQQGEIAKQKRIQKFESHKNLIGKCFKNNDKYFKVISIRADNDSRISCLEFDEHPSYYFTKTFQRAFWHCDYEGYFDFDGIYVDDEILGKVYGNAPGLVDWEEITEEEYKVAFKNYCEELLEMDWEK